MNGFGKVNNIDTRQSNKRNNQNSKSKDKTINMNLYENQR